MIHPYYGMLCNSSNKTVTHEDIKKKRERKKNSMPYQVDLANGKNTFRTILFM